MVNKQIFQLIDFARRLPHFPKLLREDQVMIVKCGWNEILIASVAFRSVEVSFNYIFNVSSIYFMKKIFVQYIEGDRKSSDVKPQLMCLGTNFTLHRNSAQQAGVAPIFDRILSELSLKMKRLEIDRIEMCCLKSIIIFNPGL